MIATLYDVHGNLRALEAVLAEVPDEATIVVGGDVCTGGPQPAETLELLRALGERIVWVRGNADRELKPQEDSTVPAEFIEPTRNALSEEQIEFLWSRPASAQIDGVLYVHASPRNDVDIFTERTPEERIAFLFADVDADVVVCGHTHMQFDRVVAGKRVVNSGSVGMPYEDDPGAYWTLDLQPRRTAHDGPSLAEGTRDEALELFTERGL